MSLLFDAHSSAVKIRAARSFDAISGASERRISR